MTAVEPGHERLPGQYRPTEGIEELLRLLQTRWDDYLDGREPPPDAHDGNERDVTAWRMWRAHRRRYDAIEGWFNQHGYVDERGDQDWRALRRDYPNLWWPND